MLLIVIIVALLILLYKKFLVQKVPEPHYLGY